MTKLREVLNILVDAVVSHVIGGRFGSQQPVIAHVLFGKTVLVMTANHRVGQIHVLNHSLQFALVLLGHLAAEDHGDLLGLADGPIHIQQALGKFVHGGTPEENQIVTVLGLREEQAVLAAGLTSFLGGEEGSERCQPLLSAPVDLVLVVSESASSCNLSRRISASEGVFALPEIDLFPSHANGQPVECWLRQTRAENGK